MTEANNRAAGGAGGGGAVPMRDRSARPVTPSGPTDSPHSRSGGAAEWPGGTDGQGARGRHRGRSDDDVRWSGGGRAAGVGAGPRGAAGESAAGRRVPTRATDRIRPARGVVCAILNAMGRGPIADAGRISTPFSCLPICRVDPKGLSPMATPQSAGRTLAVPERTGRTTHDRDSATSDRAAGLRTTGHGHRDRTAAADLDVPNAPHVPNAPRARKPNAPYANKTLPYDIGRPGNRTGRPTRVA